LVRSISSVILWLFVIGTAIILGAGLYEQLVVVPFWAAGAPASLAEGNPLLEVAVRAGSVFWSVFTPALGFIALLTLVTSFGTPPRHLAWQVASSGLLILVSIATLAYFRPAIIAMVIEHGAGRTPEALAQDAHRWVTLNWLRILAVACSLAMGIRALLLPIR
jgi:formate hydrogenlyase subunit 3/multisubunit Na+/H+ antiporter MnhD subunit